MIKKVLIAILIVGIGLTGFIDTTSFLSAEEIDERYGTTIANLGFHYKKEHHYSLFDHKDVQYIFYVTKQYSHYFVINVKVADKEKYIKDSWHYTVLKTLTTNVKGYDVEIRLYKGNAQVGGKADATVHLENGCLRVAIGSSSNIDIKDYWENDPISDESYIKIFQDILSGILTEEKLIN